MLISSSVRTDYCSSSYFEFWAIVIPKVLGWPFDRCSWQSTPFAAPREGILAIGANSLHDLRTRRDSESRVDTEKYYMN